jgi:hypothetical protein
MALDEKNMRTRHRASWGHSLLFPFPAALFAIAFGAIMLPVPVCFPLISYAAPAARAAHGQLFNKLAEWRWLGDVA